MAQVKSIDNQIIGYLGQLSEKKKKAILTIVKTFVEDIPTLWDIMPDEVRQGVERGIEQSKKSIGRLDKEVMEKYSKWLKK